MGQLETPRADRGGGGGAEAARFPLGARVRVFGAPGMAEYNGAVGKVVGGLVGGSVAVELAEPAGHAGETVKVKPAHLSRILT